ncbi:glycogen debranching protein [Trinickia terrae]|uniref:Glycogen debranching protein n=1 Tax=Trinickia terrae TaxID=2571161 RepID=A0A4U1I3J5_9BURK|nr:amylo-alpha-1,6-glucosidase [Trinickia terrae]TKC87821.1 glycogen debranching protein [Trinickia terrae]
MTRTIPSEHLPDDAHSGARDASGASSFLAEQFDEHAEWLEPDGLGGFASGTAGGERTRRYHALLLAATHPPTGRVVLVNGLQAWLETPGGNVPLSTQRYLPDVVHPDLAPHLIAFDVAPWPVWRFRIDGAATLVYELFVAKGYGETVLRWRLEGAQDVAGPLRLKVRLLLSGRDHHALHHENAAFCFSCREAGGNVAWRPYGDLPAIAALTNGTYEHAPDWYRHFLYVRERERGLDFSEDLATPGVFAFDVAARDAVIILRPNGELGDDAKTRAAELARAEHARRAAFRSRTRLSADAYFVERGTGQTLVAGYPWFTDWGRDTFIALRGLALGTRRYGDAEAILLDWSRTVSQGMLPNRFPDDGSEPEYNAVDASLWFIVAVHDYLRTDHASHTTRSTLRHAVDAVLEGYARGTRYAIGADTDGLVRAGVPGVQLTWMDAKVDGRVVTPRIGKPVEVQALWINALRTSLDWTAQWQSLEERATQAFLARFVNPQTGALYDVVDVDHEPGRVDASIRPNQIFAVGGLPFTLATGETARHIVEQVEADLLTPLGLRTLAPGDPNYAGAYTGNVRQRDAAYHQGTVWPWLIGPFVEAWLRVHGSSPHTRAEARRRFLAPLFAHLRVDGLGHVCEIADGDAPHAPRGTPFQAWSLGELLRIESLLASVQPNGRSGTVRRT